jgi:hypothetical protein
MWIDRTEFKLRAVARATPEVNRRSFLNFSPADVRDYAAGTSFLTTEACRS